MQTMLVGTTTPLYCCDVIGLKLMIGFRRFHRRRDIQHNDILHNDTRHETKHQGIICDIQHDDTQHSNTAIILYVAFYLLLC
jgi:hypothetical protein